MNHFSPALNERIQVMLWEREEEEARKKHELLIQAVAEDLEYRKIKPDLPAPTRPFHNKSQRQKRKAARRRGF